MQLRRERSSLMWLAADYGTIRGMKKITKDNCDFPTLRQSGCIYVDKTRWLAKMATDVQSRMFFLARPRRFGKSLMISTLKAMFEGRKELFKGLAIMKTGWNWKKKFPVIHLNMGMCAAAKYDEFASALPNCMKQALAGAGARYNSDYTSVVGGLGGGGAIGENGVDGLGGGGSGNRKGGSGVVIIRYRRKPVYEESFDGATGGVMARRSGHRVHTFMAGGTFTMPCVGKV